MTEASSGAPPIAALVGKDVFLQLAALADVVRLLPGGSQISEFDGDTAELADVLDETRSFAMFSVAKAVIVRNGDEFVKKYRQQLEDYLQSPANSATLILRLEKLPSNQRIYKLIAKAGKIIPCEPPRDLGKWIIERGRGGHAVTVLPEAARMLADLVGDDLGRLDNELAKLALGSTSGTIGPRDVNGAVAFQREREMWDLTNALGVGNTADALRRWRQLIQLESSAEFRAVTWLGLWLENVRRALDMLGRGNNAYTIGQALRIWPRDMQQPFVDTAAAMGEEGLNRALNLLAEIDFQSKTGVGDAADNVERFILALAAAGAKIK